MTKDFLEDGIYVFRWAKDPRKALQLGGETGKPNQRYSELLTMPLILWVYQYHPPLSHWCARRPEFPFTTGNVHYVYLNLQIFLNNNSGFQRTLRMAPLNAVAIHSWIWRTGKSTTSPAAISTSILVKVSLGRKARGNGWSGGLELTLRLVIGCMYYYAHPLPRMYVHVLLQLLPW